MIDYPFGREFHWLGRIAREVCGFGPQLHLPRGGGAAGGLVLHGGRVHRRGRGWNGGPRGGGRVPLDVSSQGRLGSVFFEPILGQIRRSQRRSILRHGNIKASGLLIFLSQSNQRTSERRPKPLLAIWFYCLVFWWF